MKVSKYKLQVPHNETSSNTMYTYFIGMQDSQYKLWVSFAIQITNTFDNTNRQIVLQICIIM